MKLEIALQPKQSQLLDLVKHSIYTVIGYGGSNGGAKSHGIRDVNLILCTEEKKAPIKTLIFRRKSNDLLENHINPFFQKYPELEKYFNKSERMIYWPDGSTTKFGYAEYEHDIYDFQGKEYDYIFIDEATHCTQPMIEFLRSRNRSSSILAKMVLTMNPGNIGHNYIKRIFITRKYLNYENPSEYIFLAAKVWDNVIWSEKALKERGYNVKQYYEEWNEEKRRDFTLKHSDYAQTLTGLPEAKKKAMLYGDWSVLEGQFFGEWFEDIHIIKPKNYLSYQDIKEFYVVAGMDYGNVSVVEYMYKDYNNNVVVFDEWYDKKSTRSEKVSSLKEFIIKRDLQKIDIIADTNLWLPDQFDVDESNYPASDFINAGINLSKVSKNQTSPDRHRGYRVACNDAVKDYLHWEESEGVLKVKPKLKIYERCVHLIETLPALITDEKDVEDIADGQEDHCYDSMKYGFMTLYKKREPEIDTRPGWLKKLQDKQKKSKTNFATA